MDTNVNVKNLAVALAAGLVIAAAAGLAIGPAMAAGYDVDDTARVDNVPWWDVLNVRKWPAHYSQQVGALEPDTWVWVERCISYEDRSDWCKVENGNAAGWVNSRYLAFSDY